jgi:predicted aconitase with swiveling domain
MEQLILQCRNVIAGSGRLKLTWSMDSFSFVGGVNIQSGDISDYRHANYQENVTGRAFAFPFGRGSSGAGLVLMEMLRLGTAPGAIINIHTDPVILTGPLICKHFYQQQLPIVNLSEEDYQKLDGAKEIELFEDREEVVVYR